MYLFEPCNKHYLFILMDWEETGYVLDVPGE